MNVEAFKKILQKLPSDYEVCLTSYCVTCPEKLKTDMKNISEHETINLKSREGEDFFEEAPAGYENTYIQVVDDIILGLNVDKDEKRIRFVIINDLVNEYDIHKVDDIKSPQPLRLVKK